MGSLSNPGTDEIEQGVNAKWLDQEGISLACLDIMLADEMGRHQDDRDLSGLLVLLQPLTERPPIFSAQQDVEQDQVREIIAHVLETRAVQAGLDAVCCVLQDLLDQLHYRWLIIYHEDTLVHLGLFFSAPNTSMTHLRSSGREKENVDPCPSTLSTQILPP